jgi:bifunctional non-homologous end joining protein LigD
VSAYVKPQLAFDARGNLDLVPRDGNWIIEPKFDGWRWQVHVVPNRFGTFLEVRSYGGRNGKEHTGQERRLEELLEELPPCTLDCELVWEDEDGNLGMWGKKSKQLATLMVFDVLSLDGKDVTGQPWQARRQVIEKMAETYGWDPHGRIRLIPVIDDPDDFELMHRHWLAVGLEGCVAKRKDAPYRPGSRRRDGFVKVKPQSTAHAQVIDWEHGKGASNKHRCGALTLLLENGNQTTCGYDGTPERADEMIGHWIEIRHHGDTPDGLKRHPVFSRMRPDLDPVEATA